MRGWLFDAYPVKDKMVFWLKMENGSSIRLEDDWTHSIFVGASRERIRLVLKNPHFMQHVKSHEIASMYERISDMLKTDVLKLTLNHSSGALALAKEIEHIGVFSDFRLYNIDVLPAQAYFYEHELFPLAFCKVMSGKQLKWEMLDDAWSTDYSVPDLRILHLDVTVKKEGKIPKFTDRLASISIKADESYEISAESEPESLARLEREVTRIDPDIIMTDHGDSFLFPYLMHRAVHNNVVMSLGRDEEHLKKPCKEGMSYFSYGRIHFKPSAFKLKGRVHIDASTSFALDHTGLHGLYEITRICRMPMQTSSRATIGKCLSSLQFYHAYKNDILVPWKPVVAEQFKTFAELLIADRGGFIFEPRVGVFERVAELDFVSLYASIMHQKNISAETVGCKCCLNSNERLPELGYNICEKRRGIVPRALEIVLRKRSKYKDMKKSARNEQESIYDSRQSVLKWINVTSFGYLGFSNAKFGRIDAHIAVCAFDRQILLKASRIAEESGFRMLHGIVDSLWMQKAGASHDDFLRLKDKIERQIEFEISFEGMYRWIAFLESKDGNGLPVANRYFGVFEDGSIKVRGIAARRHDTPPLFSKVQMEILEIIAQGLTAEDVRGRIPEVQKTFDRYVSLLHEHNVDPQELVFTKQMSKDFDKYSARSTVEKSAMDLLRNEGKSLKGGQALRYIITDYNARACRAVPVEMIDEKTGYDSRRYAELLKEICEEITLPFGCSLSMYDREY